MRTNPFLDTWLFILGLTDVPYAEGAFKYAFAILFFGLLAASVFIAFVNWREDPAQRSRTHIAICICRVLVGCSTLPVRINAHPELVICTLNPCGA